MALSLWSSDTARGPGEAGDSVGRWQMSFLGTEWTSAPSEYGGALNHKAWVKFFIDRITLFKVLENADEFFLVTDAASSA